MEDCTDNVFENWFKEVLNGRSEVDSFLKGLSKFDDENFKIKIDGFTSCGSSEDEEEYYDEEELKEETEPDEYPGYYVFLDSEKDYKYLLFLVKLPKVGEYPVSVEFRTLKKEKEYWFSDLSSLEKFIVTTITESKEVKEIKKRILEVINNGN